MSGAELVKLIFTLVAIVAALVTVFFVWKKKSNVAATFSVVVMVVAGLIAFVTSFTGPQ